MAKPHLALVAPSPVNGAVARNSPPPRRPNIESRAREYLTEAEVERLIAAAGDNRHGHRGATLILVAFRHGLRGRPVRVGAPDRKAALRPSYELCLEGPFP
jgi:type 1 fimbriae regulatory protein FimB/type 1 fimbriae regulatory protein FimE